MSGSAVAPRRVAVVGGGIAGLAAAYRLTRLSPEIAVTLVEAEPRLGGKIVTERIDGFVIEGGPDSFLAAKPRGVGLARNSVSATGCAGRRRSRTAPMSSAGGRLHECPKG